MQLCFIILVCTNLVQAMLLQSGGAAPQQDWIFLVLNVWLLSIASLALWRFMNSTRGNLARGNLARVPQANPINTPVGEVPLRRNIVCPGAPRRRGCLNVPRHNNTVNPVPLHAALQHAQVAAVAGWAPQYHTHIYCHGFGHAHNPTPYGGVENGQGARRRSRRRWRGHEVPRLRRRFSPVGDFSSVSLSDSNEPSPVPLNTPEGSVNGDPRVQDNDSHLSSTHRRPQSYSNASTATIYE